LPSAWKEIYFPDDPIPLYIDKSSETLKLIQQHGMKRTGFGITFHRQKRSKSQTTSELDQVKGIGSHCRNKKEIVDLFIKVSNGLKRKPKKSSFL
jgi:excinuclease UvrABC nuclease subunit